MTDLRSFERIDYLLRANKHIERQLVFDLLHTAARKLGFTDHWYLGFGSMWFGDFRLAHRLIGINRMVSVEHATHANRARFNRPYASVEVKPGECSEVLAQLTVEDWAKPVVAWLDYDGNLDDEVAADISFLVGHAAPDSVLIVTVNANRNRYRKKGGVTREDTSVGVVERFLGKASIAPEDEPPQNAQGSFSDLTEADFPPFLARAIITSMQHKTLESGRQFEGSRVSFIPLFRFHHRDGMDMVTAGGALAKESSAGAWRESLASHPALLSTNGQLAHTQLDLVPLTVREKLALDTCLPTSSLEDEFVTDARAAGLCLSRADLVKYRQYYRQFPVFVETSI